MSLIWNKIENLSVTIENKFKNYGEQINLNESEFNWYNKIYTSKKFRRAHIEIVDNRQTHKIYILHCTIFPHVNDPSPIWGFDAVCGPNKITGAFHDFSVMENTNEMYKWFANEVKNIEWNKPRQLPEWAKQIFSPSMIAAGNIQDINEIDQLIEITTKTLDYYLDNVGNNISKMSYKDIQNRYCFYQKQNPHVINSMVTMGVSKEKMIDFVNQILFPEI